MRPRRAAEKCSEDENCHFTHDQNQGGFRHKVGAIIMHIFFPVHTTRLQTRHYRRIDAEWSDELKSVIGNLTASAIRSQNIILLSLFGTKFIYAT